MDHASISQDIEDLERYRAGLNPIEKKEYIGTLVTIDEVVANAMDILKDIKMKNNKKTEQS